MNLTKSIVKKVFIIISIFCLIMFVFEKNNVYANSNTEENDFFVGSDNNLDIYELHEKTRIPSYNSDNPSLTFLVHGQGGNASHWSNDEDYNFSYDSDSLIEILRAKAASCNVYLAKMFTSLQFQLIKLEYENYNLNSNTQEFITKIEDISKYNEILVELKRQN